MIAAYIEDNHKLWDVYLQKFAFALRSSVNESTKVSPAILNLGRELPLPFDRKLQDDQDVDVDSERNQSLDVPDKLAKIISFVVDNNNNNNNNNNIVYYRPKKIHILH